MAVSGSDRPPFVSHRVAGYTLVREVDRDDDCTWYEGKDDSGEQALLYIFSDPAARDRARGRIHGYRTSDQAHVEVGGELHRLSIIIGEHRILMSGELRKFLQDTRTRPAELQGYVIEDVLGHGVKGVTYRVRKKGSVHTPYAMKLTIAEEYQGKTYLPELDQMIRSAATDRDHFPQIHDCSTVEIPHDGRRSALVVFVEDLIPGKTLDKLLATEPETIDASFVYSYVTEMLASLVTLQKCGLMHDDLHMRNVMIHRSPARNRPYLIDFGSTKALGQTRKTRDDIRNLASHIAELINCLERRTDARSPHDDAIVEACQALHATISDDDPMRRPGDAEELLKQFGRGFPEKSLRQKLVHPFDFGNAEEVLDNNLLYNLAAKTFPWKDKIESSAHLLVIGPRGCGKTTVFRSLSFNCLADAGQLQEALKRVYRGLYISCNKEFRQRFSAMSDEVLLRRQDEVRHYFNLIVIREFTTALIGCESQRALGRQDVEKYRTFLLERTRWNELELCSLRDINAASIRAIHRTRLALWNDQACEWLTRQDFVADLGRLAGEALMPFMGKSLYLFVDDYTERKVPRAAQQALNHILFVPNAVYKCKVSSEVFGVVPDVTFGNFLDQDRDYKEWNLGTLFCLSLPTRQQKEFLSEIVDRRLELCEYKGRVDSLIGTSKYPEGTLARSLKAEYEKRQEFRNARGKGRPATVIDREVDAEVERSGSKVYYHGWDTMCDLCTGDVSNILELLSRMFESCGVKKNTVSTLKPVDQDSVIEDYSLQYIRKIKGIPAHGAELFAIVDAFGNMSARYLQEYPWLQRDAGRRDPYQLLRIELDEAFVRQAEQALDRTGSGTVSEPLPARLWRLLQRYCIFIDADEGRSRRNTLAGRVILRRIFCPAFRIGLANSESFTISQLEWVAFCADPAGRAEQVQRRAIEQAKERRGDGPSLFESFGDREK